MAGSYAADALFGPSYGHYNGDKYPGNILSLETILINPEPPNPEGDVVFLLPSLGDADGNVVTPVLASSSKGYE
jgi:hypothetical protein